MRSLIVCADFENDKRLAVATRDEHARVTLFAVSVWNSGPRLARAPRQRD